MAKIVCLVLFLFINSVQNADITLSEKKHPASDFSQHILVKPRIYHGREKRQVSSTKEKTSEHINHLYIELEVDGEELVLDLTLNKQLIPKGFFHRYQENGKDKVHKPSREEIELCHYNGKVRGKPDSWVALSTCDGLSGVIFDGQQLHYVEKDSRVEGGNIDMPHFWYKQSDLVETNKTCGYGGDARNPPSHVDNRILRYKREAKPKELVRGPYNANRDSKYVELVLVVDNREFKEFNENTKKVEQHCKSIANIINALYSSLNIFVALVGVVIWNEHDEISFSENGDQTLTNFLNYRRAKLSMEHPNDNAQLLTKFSFQNGVVGKALKGPICTYQFSGGVNTDHSAVVGLVATTVAHEMGHNFGMEHDTNECHCPDDRCIMAPSSSTVAPTHWSQCSINYLLQAFGHGMDYCLKNKPEALFESPVCGNGFVEPGEECDCGLPDHCNNGCCNAATCMLHSNASCATGECCDLTTCMPKNAGTLCRSADYECDLPEYCTGESEYCPADIFKLDAEECDGGKAYCYQGFCRTRTDQCKLLWGETGSSSDYQCYQMNVKGNRSGNCGYNNFNQSYQKCETENVLCGMLHCRHLNERLEFGMESVAILSHTFINKAGSIIPCRSALVDLGINQIDPGLSPDGATCGDGKMCVNQKCMSVAEHRLSGPKCPQDCNGNGWCNSLGNCHCKDGFAPPLCIYPGPGGSEDSGPAKDPNGHQLFVNIMLTIFLGVIPLLAILALAYFYLKHNFRFGANKSISATSKSPAKSRGPSSFPSETSKRAEDNHSLLQNDNPSQIGIQNEFFGNFKGFSLTPLKDNEPPPVRSAPPPPVSPKSPPNYNKTLPAVPAAPKSPVIRSNTVAAKASFFSKPVQKYNSFKANGVVNSNNVSAAPALPPPNPGSHARPIISSPVLENSTCTAKELISPLRNAPKVPIRSAPEAPPVANKENEKPEIIPIFTTEEPKKNIAKELGTSALNRIASFLKPAEKKPEIISNDLPRKQKIKVKTVIDKATLRNMTISGPIPQKDIEISITTLPVDTPETKAVVMRAQSMRSPNHAPRPHIQTFGSMRQPPGFKRPVSMASSRPKSPPPPLPPNADSKSKENIKSINDYDDCLNKAPLASLSGEISPTSGDNIYAVIDDGPKKVETPAKELNTSTGSSDNFGLLGEIVSEIQNRNFDSIYSTSTLARKKKQQEEEKQKQLQDTYVNTSSITSDGEYSNMNNGKSSASSTSSGYINPSSVNVPVNKSYVSPYNRQQGLLASTFKPTSPTAIKKVLENDTNTPINKTPPPAEKSSTTIDKSPPSNVKTTPPAVKSAPLVKETTTSNLRMRKPSPPGLNRRSITNSPDLVTSCNTSPNTKTPDVLNGGNLGKKPIVATAKPVINKTPANKTTSKSVSFKSPQAKSEVIKPPIATKVTKAVSDASAIKNTNPGLKNAAKQTSNVANLQQKFEKTQSAKNVPAKAKT